MQSRKGVFCKIPVKCRARPRAKFSPPGFTDARRRGILQKTENEKNRKEMSPVRKNQAEGLLRKLPRPAGKKPAPAANKE